MKIFLKDLIRKLNQDGERSCLICGRWLQLIRMLLDSSLVGNPAGQAGVTLILESSASTKEKNLAAKKRTKAGGG